MAMTETAPHPWRRIMLWVSYDGTRYKGWQRQQNAPSVQQTIEEAMEKALKQKVVIHGASRTDAGVHALGQAAHFDTKTTIPADRFPFMLNTRLPHDIRVWAAVEIPDVAHARYSSRGKIYTYRIHNHRHASAMYRHLRAHVPVPIDVEKMRNAARLLLGTHDYKAFASVGSVAKSTVRHVQSIDITRTDEEITLVVMGTAFLYNMVRIMVGTLIEVGQDRLSSDVITQAFETGNRLILGPTAPAHGLELTRVFYPWDEDVFLEGMPPWKKTL